MITEIPLLRNPEVGFGKNFQEIQLERNLKRLEQEIFLAKARGKDTSNVGRELEQARNLVKAGNLDFASRLIKKAQAALEEVKRGKGAGESRAFLLEEKCEHIYQDFSSDPGVSFKMPTKLSHAEAEYWVRQHEGEHVMRETTKAKMEGKEAIATVTYHYKICPRCGERYLAGGTTRVVIKSKVVPQFPDKGNKIDAYL